MCLSGQWVVHNKQCFLVFLNAFTVSSSDLVIRLGCIQDADTHVIHLAMGKVYLRQTQIEKKRSCFPFLQPFHSLSVLQPNTVRTPDCPQLTLPHIQIDDRNSCPYAELMVQVCCATGCFCDFIFLFQMTNQITAIISHCLCFTVFCIY